MAVSAEGLIKTTLWEHPTGSQPLVSTVATAALVVAQSLHRGTAAPATTCQPRPYFGSAKVHSSAVGSSPSHMAMSCPLTQV